MVAATDYGVLQNYRHANLLIKSEFIGQRLKYFQNLILLNKIIRHEKSPFF